MIKAITMGLIVALLTILMDRSLRGENFLKKVNKDGKERTEFNMAGFDDSETWVRAIGYGIAVGVLAFASSFTWWLAVICLEAMMLLMIQYAWWWGFAGTGGLRALIWFLLIQCVIQSVAGDAVRVVLGTNLIGGSRTLTSLVQVLPAVIGALCNGSAIVGACRHCDKNGLATLFIWLTIIGVIFTAVGGIAVAASGINFGNLKTQVTMPTEIVSPEPAPMPMATPEPTLQSAPALTNQQVSFTTPVPTNTQPMYGNQYGGQYSGNQYGQYQYGNGQLTEWWTFYNLMIQNDGLLNDNNFGPDPYKEGWWVTEYVNEMLARIWKDPVLGAADIAYFDHIAGTNISGVAYDKDPQKWLDKINARAVEFVKDQAMYNRVVEEFTRALNNPNIVQKVEILQRNNIKNLMFMEPNNMVNLNGYGGYGYNNYGYGNYGYNYGSNYTIKMPKVIMKAHNEQAWFLIFTVKNGSSTGEALYKLACGYQPPIEGTGNGGGINPGGNNTPGSGPSNPDGPTWVPKDPTKGTDVGKNDTTGPGPNTNNGVGARTSTADQSTNSTSMSYSDYKDTMTDLGTVSTNGDQRVGGDPNTPTVSTPSGADVSNNANNGNGYGGIDVGTTVESYVQTDGGVAVHGQTETHIAMPD